MRAQFDQLFGATVTGFLPDRRCFPKNRQDKGKYRSTTKVPAYMDCSLMILNDQLANSQSDGRGIGCVLVLAVMELFFKELVAIVSPDIGALVDNCYCYLLVLHLMCIYFLNVELDTITGLCPVDSIDQHYSHGPVHP